MTVTMARREIRLIDSRCNQIHRELCRLERVDRGSFASWQAAWDKHPAFRAEENALYIKRGELQRIVNVHEEAEEAKRDKQRRRLEARSASARGRVWQYLYECHRAAEKLGVGDLAQYYANGLAAISRSEA